MHIVHMQRLVEGSILAGVFLTSFCVVLESSYICSAQSENLRNLEIALRILGIPRLRNYSAQSFTQRACAHTISWFREELLKNSDFVSVL